MPESYLKSKQQGPDLLILAFMLVILCYGAISTVSLHFHKKNISAQLLLVQQVNRKLSKNISEIEIDNEKGRRSAAQRKLVSGITDSQYKWSKAFKEISHLIPSDTWLSKFDATNTNGNLELLIEGETSSQYQMANFFRSLERSYYYNKVSISFSEIMDQYTPELFKFQFKTQNSKVASVPKNITKGRK